MQIKQKAAQDFVEHAKLYLKRTAWAQTCSSWFKPPGQEAADPIMHPGNRMLVSVPKGQLLQFDLFPSTDALASHL